MFYDNFFLSVDLALDPLYSCGTLRSNHKGFLTLLKPVVKKGLHRRGTSKIHPHGNLTVTVWQDNRPVTLNFTNSDPTTTLHLHPTKPPCERVLKWHELTLPSSWVTSAKRALLLHSPSCEDQALKYQHVVCRLLMCADIFI